MDVIEPWAEGGSIYTNPIGIDMSGIGWSKSIEVTLFRRSMRAAGFSLLSEFLKLLAVKFKY